MVKVVGTDEKHVHKVTCKNCASILEYMLVEVTYSYTTDYGGGKDAYNYIVCPKCIAKVEVKG